jgi:hypothetical protein
MTAVSLREIAALDILQRLVGVTSCEIRADKLLKIGPLCPVGRAHIVVGVAQHACFSSFRYLSDSYRPAANSVEVRTRRSSMNAAVGSQQANAPDVRPFLEV